MQTLRKQNTAENSRRHNMRKDLAPEITSTSLPAHLNIQKLEHDVMKLGRGYPTVLDEHTIGFAAIRT